MSEHTKGELEIWQGFGQSEKEGDPRYYLGFPTCAAGFSTLGGNDKANAERLRLCWNSHDDLMGVLDNVLKGNDIDKGAALRLWNEIHDTERKV